MNCLDNLVVLAAFEIYFKVMYVFIYCRRIGT